MENIEESILKLTNEWYFLIGKDHHKDRDCHWYIETKWSYGLLPKYYIRHFGYILDEIEILCDRYEDSLKKLKNCLENVIKKEKEYIENEDSEW